MNDDKLNMFQVTSPFHKEKEKEPGEERKVIRRKLKGCWPPYSFRLWKSWDVPLTAAIRFKQSAAVVFPGNTETFSSRF